MITEAMMTKDETSHFRCYIIELRQSGKRLTLQELVLCATSKQAMLGKYEYNRYLFAPPKSRKHFNKRCLMQMYC
jgi:hypothetical protein